MSEKFDSMVEGIITASKCKEEFDKYQECLASNKNKDKCRPLFSVYQFCIVDREENRLNKNKAWEEFRKKWGHYPNQTANNE